MGHTHLRRADAGIGPIQRADSKFAQFSLASGKLEEAHYSVPIRSVRPISSHTVATVNSSLSIEVDLPILPLPIAEC